MSEIDNFKTNKKDITILWDSQRNLSPEILAESIFKPFPSFNVEIFDANSSLIVKYIDIPSSDLLGAASLASEESKRMILDRNPAVIFANPRKKMEVFRNQDLVKNNFTFSIEENSKIFKEKNGYDGFYDKVIIKITHNDSFQISYQCLVEYNKFIDNETIKSSILKTYRSSDNLSLKIKFDSSIYDSYEINSFLILAKAIKNDQEFVLNPIIAEEINTKWLDTVDGTKIITLPFIENDILEESSFINVEIYPLLPFNLTIIKNIKNKENLLNFVNTNLNYKLNYNNLYKNGTILPAVNFEGFLYLFTKNSFLNLSWPENNIKIAGVNYSKYFPIANINNINTICTYIPPDVESSVLEIVEQDFDKPLGYYDKNQNKFYDIKMDLPYFKSLNISGLEIFEIDENDNDYILYIKFKTLLSDLDDIILNNNSSNITFVKKYYENINDKNYICLIFSTKYSKNNSSEFNISNIIKEKIAINFSFVYNN